MTSVDEALSSDLVIDITTTGRKTGEPRRIEIWFHRIEDRYYITGTPGARAWYANLLAEPHFTFRLKESAQADLPATAVPVTGEEKARLLRVLQEGIPAGSDVRLDPATSPLVEVRFEAA